MNTIEARALLEAHLGAWRQRPYPDLVAHIGEPSCSELRGASGTLYQLEIEVLWDHLAGGDIRVLGSIDDGGLRALIPLSSSFLLSPDGRVVGEASE